MPESEAKKRGRLKIYLGYAAGVGKTYRMLEEAHQLRAAGVDVVVGYFEPHGRQDTIDKMNGLELIPRRRIRHRDVEFEEMDPEAILARRPAVCAVDEFPHTNVPGAERTKRWEDVEVLQEAGIDVLTTMNIQHLESLNDEVRKIAGIQVRETIPDWVVKQADELVLIDLPPRALLNRLQRGAVYAREKAQQAMENFFQETTLAALRELAMRQAAHEVDLRRTAEERWAPGDAGRQERILLHLTESPATAGLIRRGRRVADYLRADCIGVGIAPAHAGGRRAREAREVLDRHLEFARKLRIETRVLEGGDVAAALVEFARRNGVTQIFLQRPPRRWFPFLSKRHEVMRVVDMAKDIQVTIVAERRGRPGS